MDIANVILRIYLSENFIQTAFIAVVFATALGQLFDRALGDASLGALINSAIILFAIAAAMAIEDRRILALLPDNALRISMIASAIGSGLVIMTMSLRKWIRQHA